MTFPTPPIPPHPPRRPSAGPWVSHDVNDETDDCGMWVVDIPNDGEITVTRLYFGDMETNTGRDICNADLVAAAPDLLRHVIFAAETFEKMRASGFVPRRGVTFHEAAAEFRKTIAKATGDPS